MMWSIIGKSLIGSRLLVDREHLPDEVCNSTWVLRRCLGLRSRLGLADGLLDSDRLGNGVWALRHVGKWFRCLS